VEDALVKNALYQLADYWPAGKGAGRRFSVRFGILGRAWRLGRSLYEDDVPIDEDKLIEQWGMTRAQARSAASGKRSFVCVMLSHGGQNVGVLFMDAMPANAFQSDILDRFHADASMTQLAAAVGQVRQRIGRLGPGIKLLDDD
jgi:transcriptional regulator with GAF, ATPase, and Fis domain